MARQWIWVQGNPKPKKLSKYDKEELPHRVTAEIEKYPELKACVHRMQIKGGRIYLFKLFEPKPLLSQEHYTVPLIDGRYFETIMARITIFDTDCSLDFLRHNDEWMTLEKGTLEECIEKMVGERSVFFLH